MIKLTTNNSEFQAALQAWALSTTRELSKALNHRLFYVLLRLYVLLNPRNVTESRNKVRAYLNEVLSERVTVLKSGRTRKRARSRQLMRVMLIAQAIRKKRGLKPVTPRDNDFAQVMKTNIAKLRRRGISAQGYLKASVVKALRSINMATYGVSFTQYGNTSVVIGKRSGSEGYSRSNPRMVNGVAQVILKRREVQPNAALVKIAAEYGLVNPGNVAIFKSVKGSSDPASDIKKTAEATMEMLVRDNNTGKVEAQFNTAIAQALADEAESMRDHMAAKAQEVANAYMK